MPTVKSKFKHVFTDTPASEAWYRDVSTSGFFTTGDSNFASASAKYFAAHGGAGGGPLLVFKLRHPGRKGTMDKPVHPVQYHKVKVQISQWCPHSDDILASGDSNGDICIGQFSEDNFDDDTGCVTEDGKKPMVSWNAAPKPITALRWHPSVQGLLAIGSKDGKIKFYDAMSGEQTMDNKYAHLLVGDDKTNAPVSIDFAYDGVHMCCVEKSGASHKLHIFDILNGETEAVGKGLKMIPKATVDMKMKNCQSLFVCCNGDGVHKYQYVMVCGMVASSGKRLVKYFDMEGAKMGKWEIPEKGSQPVMPHWDASREILWYYGKGDLSMSFALWQPKKLKFFSMGTQRVSDSTAINGGCFVPQRGNDPKEAEVMQFYALRKGKLGPHIAPFKFTVPRRNAESFDDSLFPQCPGLTPVCTLEEFMTGNVEITAPSFVSQNPDADVEVVSFEKKQTYGELVKEIEMLKGLLKANNIEIPEA